MADVNTPFAIPLSVGDHYSRIFEDFKKKANATFGQVDRKVREVGESGKKLGEAFEPFAKLLGAGGALAGGIGLAGAIEQIEDFAHAGAEIGRTSARIGVGAAALQNIGHAAFLAGANAQSGAEGLETLGQKLHDAAWGRDQQAIAVFKEFGINVRDANLHVRSADEVLPELADKIKSLHDPYQQAALATATLGGAGRDLLPFLRDGREGIEEYRAEVRKYGADISEHGIKLTRQFEKSQATVDLALLGVRNRLAEDFLPTMIQVANKTAGWLNDLRQSPAAMGAVEKGAGALAVVLGTTLVGAIGKMTVAMNRWWALPAVKFLVGGRAALARTGMIGLGITAGSELGEMIGNPEGYKKSMGHALEEWKGLFSHLFGHHSKPMQPVALSSSIYDAIARAEGTMGAQGIDYNMVRGGGHMPLTDMTLARVFAYQAGTGGAGVGGFQIDRGTLGDAVAGLGLGMNTKFTPDVQRRLADWIKAKQGWGAWRGFKAHPEFLPKENVGAYGVPGAIMNFGEHGGVGAPGTNLVQLRAPDGKNYTVNAAAADAFGGFVKDLEAVGYPIESIGGYNFRQKTGGGSLSEHAYGLAVDINPASNPYGSHRTNMPANIHDLAAKWGLIWGGDWSSSPDPMHFQWGGSKPWLDAANAGGNDSAHHVQIDVNAPAGTRARLVSATGAANFVMKLGHAMTGP